MRRTTLSTLDMNRSIDHDASFADAPLLAKRKSFGAPGTTRPLADPVSTKKAVAQSSRTPAAPGGASFSLDPRCVGAWRSRGGRGGRGADSPASVGRDRAPTDQTASHRPPPPPHPHAPFTAPPAHAGAPACWVRAAG